MGRVSSLLPESGVDKHGEPSSRLKPMEELRAALRRLVPAGFPRGDVPVRLAGEIHVAGALCDIVALLAQSGRSGTLVVSTPDALRAIAIERGELMGASTTAACERLGEVMYRSGVLGRHEIDELVMTANIEGRLFGETVRTAGRIDEVTLDALLVRQAEEVVYAALRTDDGVFCFVEERLGVPCTASTRPSLGGLLMEAARRMDEMLMFRERVSSSRHVPSRSDAPPARTESVSPEAGAVLALADGSRSVEEIGRELGLLELDVTRELYELSLAGLVEIGSPRIRCPGDMIDIFNDALVDLHRRCDRLRCGDDLRRALRRYVATSADLAALFDGLAPHDDGSLDVPKVLRNAGIPVSDPRARAGGLEYARREALVRSLVGGYVDFAVFHAGSLLPSTAAAELPQVAGRILEPLSQPESGVRARTGRPLEATA